MKICYIDEAGCCGSLPNATSDIQPSLAIAGLIVDYGRLHATTLRLLDLKQRFFPGQISNGTTRLGRILFEIKGSDLRKGAVAGGRPGELMFRQDNAPHQIPEAIYVGD